jgi:predicted unusual protein kinase regulating ubiquinone biosynthesis (AarF/ABC1/UbiB family)
VRLSLKPRHLSRYGEIARLLLKHGRMDMVRQAGLEDALDADDADDADEADVATTADADELAADLEGMGPTFVKLGQLLSTRADLLPPVYLQALSRLQDKVDPFSFADVERIVSEELGVRISQAFQEFESTPHASASLGQVHRAVLRSGQPVAVKVQRPGIRDQILDDMDVIEEIAAFVDSHTEAGRRYQFADMVGEFRRSLLAELDYRQEARNLRALHRIVEPHELIVVPLPVDDYSTSHVLTMDWIEGRNVSSLGPLAKLDVDGAPLARALFEVYLDQVLVEGFFHADPHPGNVLVTADNRLALIDVGMVARVAPEMQDSLVRLLLALSRGVGADAADVMIDVGERLETFDRAEFRRRVGDLISRNLDTAVGDAQAGALLGQLVQTAGDCGLRAPSELTMLGKALLNLDEVARSLDPDFEPNRVIERYGADVMRRKMLQSASPANVMAAAMEAKEFAEKLPGRVNKVMDALADGRLTLNIQGIDERELMRGVQKLANRLTTGLVVAALVIGAALIMRVDAKPKLFGYPALAIVLFLIAAGAGACLLVSIILSDLPQKRRRHRR